MPRPQICLSTQTESLLIIDRLYTLVHFFSTERAVSHINCMDDSSSLIVNFALLLKAAKGITVTVNLSASLSTKCRLAHDFDDGDYDEACVLALLIVDLQSEQKALNMLSFNF